VFPYEDFLVLKISIPSGMSEDDVVCRACFDEIKEAENELTVITRQLLARTPEYKQQWDKNGIIQLKNERIAVLRHYGAQVEFIIAFDDLTADEYGLKAIDEGKPGDSQGFSGDVNSYFYFQKKDSIK